jgi:hypothetical protein
MRTFYILVGIILSAGIMRSVAAQETKPRMKIGAYYFAGWSGKSLFDDGSPGHQWAKGMPALFTKKLANDFAGRMPVWGWRDDTQELMERQINLAADHGLAYFSFCWYWADNKGPVNLSAIESDPKHLPMQMFMQATNNWRMEFCLLVANHEGFEIVGTESWKQAADYWITLFAHPRYLKVDGKPLIVIFSPEGADSEGFAYLQDAARNAGMPGVAIACCGRGSPEVGYTLRTHYNIIPGYGQPSERHHYSELVEATVREWHGIPQQPYIPVATVGWDRRPWEYPDGLPWDIETSWFFEGNTPEAFGRFLECIVQWMDAYPEQTTKERLAVVCAWNEMGEGSWLIPCKNDPDGVYLKALRSVVLGKF